MHLPELAIFPFTESRTWGITRNPWKPDRSPGGSSGGSGTAVAAGLAAVSPPPAMAAARSGSRPPAAACSGSNRSVAACRCCPTGRHWHGLSVIGCVSRSVLDTALYLDAVSGPAEGDGDVAAAPSSSFVEAARSSPAKLRIAVSTRPIAPGPVDKRVKGAVAETAELLRGLGHEVRDQDPAWGLQVPAFLPRWMAGDKRGRETRAPPGAARAAHPHGGPLGAPTSGAARSSARLPPSRSTPHGSAGSSGTTTCC